MNMTPMAHLMKYSNVSVLWCCVTLLLHPLIARVEPYVVVPSFGTRSSAKAAAAGVNAFSSTTKHNSDSTKLSLSLRVDFDDKDGLTFDPDGPRITFQGRKMTNHYFAAESVEVQQSSRTLLRYLALPAEEYSVLDAGTIYKTPGGAPNQFTCTLDPITFLGNTIIARIYAVVDVSPYPEGLSVIRVTGCTLDGSRLAKLANGSFEVSCTNIVR